MEKDQLIALADKFLKGVATPEEKALLHAWYDSWKDDEEEISTEVAMLKDEVRKKMFSQLRQALFTEPAPVIKTSGKRKRYLVAAASIALLLTASTIYLISSNNNSSLTSVPQVAFDTTTYLAPGGDRAVLTLADGSTIILDSAANGSLSQQGGVEVVKKQDGQLVYNIDEDSPVPQEVQYNTISTPRGGQYKLTLPDGTKVWLNAETSLKYPTIFNDEERKVELTGEAYFEVAAAVSNNQKIPFLVHTGNTEVKVLGTHFNINAYADEDEVKTTLVEGKVHVYSVKNRAYNLPLSPGQQASWQDEKADMKLVADADLEQVLAWKNGYFKFQSTELSTIMRQVARWYDVEIVYEGAVEKETFSGDMPRAEYASEVFKLLELTKTVKFNTDGKKVIINAVKK